MTSIMITTTEDNEHLFEIFITDTLISQQMVQYIRSYILEMTMDFKIPKLILFIKLFHKDKTFDNMFIKSVVMKDEKYEIEIYTTEKKTKIKIILGLDKSWKSFKKMLCDYFKNRECFICCEKSPHQINCLTCNNLVCKDCITIQFEKMFHLKCPFCKISLIAIEKDKEQDLIDRMKQLPIEIRKNVAKKYINLIYKQ